MLVSLAVAVMVAASSGATEERDDEPVTPKPMVLTPDEAKPDALSFDSEPPAKPKEWQLSDDRRVQRFLGTFAGAMVGVGAIAAVVPFTAPPPSTFFGCTTCVDPGQAVLAVSAPLVGTLTAWFGSLLFGGESGVMTGFAGLVPGILFALMTSGVAAAMQLDKTLPQVPMLVASGLFLSGMLALSHDVRNQQLSALGSAQSWGGASPGRTALELVVGLLSTGAAVASTVLLSFLNPFMGIAAGVVQSFGVVAATWGAHAGLKGRGSLLSAFAGFGLGAVALAAGLGLMAVSVNGFGSALQSLGAPMLVVGLGAVAAGVLPSIALEWSHTERVVERLPKLTLGAAPLAQGGVVSAGLVF